jgi:hypothetical protein
MALSAINLPGLLGASTNVSGVGSFLSTNNIIANIKSKKNRTAMR